MDEGNKLLFDYYEKFGKPAGIPIHGFSNDEIAREFVTKLKSCIESGVPLSKKDHAKFFPRYKKGTVV